MANSNMVAGMALTADSSFEEVLEAEYTRLRGLCAHLVDNPGAVEDLVQETLLEAWRNRHKFVPQPGAGREQQARWLTAIARNVCLRWRRSHGRESACLILPALDEAASGASLDELAASSEDMDVALERAELALLLDRALALLPSATRTVLIERYIHEASHAEIAERLGLSEDALVQRLYRGKLALRKVMETHLRAEAMAYGLVGTEDTAPVRSQLETRIRCPLCNQAWLNKCDDLATGQISFHCPVCSTLTAPRSTQHWQGMRSPKAILKRQLAYLSAFYWQAINQGQIPCPQCGRPSFTRVLSSSDMPASYRERSRSTYASCIRCEYCQGEDINPLSHLALDVPEAQQFWQEQSRIFWLPEREITYADQPALLSGFQSASSSARLEIILRRESLKILAIHTSTC